MGILCTCLPDTASPHTCSCNAYALTKRKTEKEWLPKRGQPTVYIYPYGPAAHTTQHVDNIQPTAAQREAVQNQHDIGATLPLFNGDYSVTDPTTIHVAGRPLDAGSHHFAVVLVRTIRHVGCDTSPSVEVE